MSTAVVNQGLWLASGLLLFVVALVRFNRPPTNRTGTSFLLFYTGVLFYYALLTGLWLLVILLLSAGGYGLDELGSVLSQALKASEQLNSSLPVIGLLFIAVASQFKLVRKIDAAARQFCIQLAAIPTEAEALGLELSHSAELQLGNRALVERISREICENIGRSALNFANDGTLASRFTRAVSLYWLFIMPDNSGAKLPFQTNSVSRTAYARIMHLNQKTVEIAIGLYDNLMENALAYFTSTKPTREMDEALRHNIQELSQIICSLIARYVLYLDVTENQRRRRLSGMGLNARDHLPAFGKDQWIASILAIIILFVFMSIVIPGRQSFSQAFMYSVMMAIQLGIAIAGGTIVAQRFIRRSEGTGGQFPPLAELTASALVVIGLCIMLRLGWPLVPSFLATGHIALADSLDQFSIKWPFLILPFVCTLSIGLLCSYLSRVQWTGPRLAAVGGLLNSVSFLVAGFLIASLLSDDLLRQNINDQIDTAREIIIGSTGISGFIIGMIVLGIFPRCMRANESSSLAPLERGAANTVFQYQEAPEQVSDAETSLPRTATRDLGGYTRASVEDLEGRYVCFRPMFNRPEVINAYQITIRWDEARTCLVFEEQMRADGIHTQRGQVFIPDGRPFMNLVTVDKGAIRVIMVTRPDHIGIGRGLVITLSNPGGIHFVPASAPVVLRRLGEMAPQFGYVHPGAGDYKMYRDELDTVAPAFAIFAALASRPTVNPTQSELASASVPQLSVIEGAKS